MLIAAMLLQAATAPSPQLTDGRALDAVDLFMTKCATQMGNVALGRQLDADPAHARSMAAAELAGFGATSPDAEGWIVHGDAGGWMGIVYRPSIRTCQVTVRAVDQKAMERALSAAVTQLYVDFFKAKRIDAKPLVRSTVDAVGADTLAWEIRMGRGLHIGLFASVADAETKGRQALMTFTILK